MKNTIIKQKDPLDRFYTNDHVSNLCVSTLLSNLKVNPKNFQFIEPSAGNGSFLRSLELKGINKVESYDIFPASSLISKMDFFSYSPLSGSRLLFIGNPPFGKNSSLAIKFFNHAASFDSTQVIAFILPRSFKKQSIQNKLNLNFILEKEIDLPSESFTHDNKPYSLPCIFQIWKRSKTKRQKINPESTHIEFTIKENAQFCIRRVGANSGKILKGLDHNSNTTYFCKERTPGVLKFLKNFDFSNYINSTTAARSLSKLEINTILNDHF